MEERSECLLFCVEVHPKGNLINIKMRLVGQQMTKKRLSTLRLWLMNVVRDSFYESKRNGKRLIIHSSQNSGLRLPFENPIACALERNDSIGQQL